MYNISGDIIIVQLYSIYGKQPKRLYAYRSIFIGKQNIENNESNEAITTITK